MRLRESLRVMLGLFLWLGASAVFSQQFKVLRGTVTIGSGLGTIGDSKTITEGVDYDLDPAATLANSFIRITNASYTTNGTTTGVHVASEGAHLAYISDPKNLLTSITFKRGRTGTSDEVNVVVAYEIIQYLGPVGGPDEIIVRNVQQKNTANLGLTANGENLPAQIDIDKSAAIITSQAHDDPSNQHSNAGLFTLEFVQSGSNRFVRGTRGDDQGIGKFSYAVVEFRGYQWRSVQRIAISPWSSTWNGVDYWTPSTNNDSETMAITDLGGVELNDPSKAFLHGQFRWDNTNGLTYEARMSQTYEISGPDQLRRRFALDPFFMDVRHTVLWIAESIAPTMLVQRQNHHLAAVPNTGTQTTTTYTLATAVAATNRASVWGEFSSSLTTGGGQLFRRAINFSLASTSTVAVTISRQDGGNRRSFEVVEWPAGPVAGPTNTPAPTPTSTWTPTATPVPTSTPTPTSPTPTPILGPPPKTPLTIRTEGISQGGYVRIELYLDGEASLNGLALRLHFDAAQLTFDGVEEIFQSSVGSQTLTEIDDFDADPATTTYQNLGWSASNWPGAGASHLLVRLRFVPIGTPDTTLRVTIVEDPPGYSISTAPFNIPEDLN